MSQSLVCLLLSLFLLTLWGCTDSPQTKPPTSVPEKQTLPPPPPPENPPVLSKQPQLDPPSPPKTSPKPIDPWLSPNEKALAERGIRRYASDRITIYSDLPQDDVAPLPPLVDQFVRIVDEFLGSPPATLVNDSRPIVGYLMKDQQKFEELKLLPNRIPPHHTGWHLDRTVWMQAQQQPYYQRHLLFHEVVHASLNSRIPRGLPPWLEEGLAELLATHRLVDNSLEWVAIPSSADELDGWRRIDDIRNHLKQSPAYTLEEIGAWTGEKYVTPEAYAWSWGLCFYLVKHPQHTEPFRKWLRKRLSQRDPLPPPWSDWSPEQRAEWNLYLMELDYGLDLDSWALSTSATPVESLKVFPVSADRGWQATGLNVTADTTYAVEVSGQINLSKDSPDWTSTSRGISIQYASGQPLGRLLARLLITDSDGSKQFGPVIPVGDLQTWKPGQTGELFLRINDRYADLDNNSGQFTVSIITDSE